MSATAHHKHLTWAVGKSGKHGDAVSHVGGAPEAAQNVGCHILLLQHRQVRERLVLDLPAVATR